MRQHESDIRPERAASPRHRTHRRASRLAVVVFGALVVLGAIWIVYRYCETAPIRTWTAAARCGDVFTGHWW